MADEHRGRCVYMQEDHCIDHALSARRVGLIAGRGQDAVDEWRG